MDLRYHDATLLTIEYSWASRSVTVRVRTSRGEQALQVQDVARLVVPYLQPWGPSMSINMIRSGPSELPGTRIEIGMQSGDVIVIESDVQEHDVHWLDGEDPT